MDDEQGPWWTQPPEPPRSTASGSASGSSPDAALAPPRAEQSNGAGGLRHPGLKLSRASTAPSSPAPPRPRWTATPSVKQDPDQAGSSSGLDAQDGQDAQLRVNGTAGDPDGSPTQALDADDIFATFTQSAPEGIITGPIPSQAGTRAADRPDQASYPGRPGAAPFEAQPPQLEPAADHPWHWPGDPRILLAGGAGVLVVVVIALLLLAGGGGKDAHKAGATPSTTALTGASAAEASFGGQRPKNLTEVSSSTAGRLLAKAGQKGGGSVVEGWTWNDKNGSNLVVTTRKTLTHGHTALTVIHVARLDTDKPDTLRGLREPTLPQCRAGGTAGFTKNSLLVRDLNQDGVAEIAAGWSSRCGSQKSSEVKLALITGDKKFIIRGDGVIGGKSGAATADPSKQSDWPAGYLKALQALFHHLYY